MRLLPSLFLNELTCKDVIWAYVWQQWNGLRWKEQRRGASCEPLPSSSTFTCMMAASMWGLQNREPWGPRTGRHHMMGNSQLQRKKRGKVQHDTQNCFHRDSMTRLPKWYNWSISNRSKKRNNCPPKPNKSITSLLFVWNVWNQRVTCVRILSSKCHKWKQRNQWLLLSCAMPDR